jgi:signal peptidase I
MQQPVLRRNTSYPISAEGWRVPGIMSLLFYSIILVIFTKSFLIEDFRIPGSSMENTMLPGDRILCDKLTFGPRVLSFPFKIPFTGKQPLAIRLPGLSPIRHNDLLLFNYPGELDKPVHLRSYFIKRCVALPGDVISIKDRKILIGDSPLPDPEVIKHTYVVKTAGSIDAEVFNKFGIAEFKSISKGYIIYASPRDAMSLSSLKAITAVMPNVQPVGERANMVFPHSDLFRWNQDNMGKLKVPARGTTIEITPFTLALYRQAITQHEGWSHAEVKHNTLYINGRAVEKYTFRQNYYFVIGDNRHNSHDSRFWGFLPEDHIVGKPVSVLYSATESTTFRNSIRWERTGKLLY